jgi:hypothetical protein
MLDFLNRVGATEVIAITGVVAALCAPGISAWLVERSNKSNQKRQTRITIFGILMENRHAPQSREALRALNLIEVAFHDSPEIRRIWREYHGMISNDAFFQSQVGIQLTQQKMFELQSAMAKSLKFGIDQFDVERVYAPRWLVEEEEIRQRERDAKLSLLRGGSVTGHQQSSSTQLTEGYYSTKFEGVPGGSGAGVVLIQNGTIAGADVTGARYEGSYRLEGGRMIGEVFLSARAGQQLVTGQTIEENLRIPIKLDFPIDFAGKTQIVSVQGREVKLIFARI